MRETVTAKDGRVFELPTDDEDKAITEAAFADPDAQPWTKEELADIRPERFRFPRGSVGLQFVLRSCDADKEKTEAK